MARARNIKPGFFDNELLVELSFEYRLLFIGLWTIADKAGRLEDRSKKIKMQVFPADNVDVDGGLTELEKAGFIVRYAHGTDKFIQINNWNKHQAPHHTERASVIPPLNNGEVTEESPSDLRGNPPDSLIPDSLIQVNPPIAPQGGIVDGIDAVASENHPTAKPKSQAKTFAKWIDEVRANGEKAVSDYAPVWKYADDLKLPRGFVEIAWVVFRDRFSSEEKAQRKRYTDWRKTFLNYVRNNYLKLWFWSERDNQWTLTTAGVQADRAAEVMA